MLNDNAGAHSEVEAEFVPRNTLYVLHIHSCAPIDAINPNETIRNNEAKKNATRRNNLSTAVNKQS